MKKVGWFPLAIVFASVYFFSMNGLGALPLLAVNFLLKDGARLTPEQLAYFQAVTLIAWVVKPLWGLVSDLFPIFGSRRKSYLMLTSLFAAAAWFILACLPDPGVARLLLLFMTLIYMAYAFQDVVTDGLMVETGQPLNITDGVDRALTGTNNQRPDQILANPYKDNSARPFTQWFDPAAFAPQGLGTFGNVGYNAFVGPRTWSFDMALSRTFNLREMQRLEVRAEAFNVTNSFRPGNPGTAINSNTFGQIRTSQDPRILQFALKYVF